MDSLYAICKGGEGVGGGVEGWRGGGVEGGGVEGWRRFHNRSHL
jgi:hypothetical protein